jgi:uncharacterized protein (UPF0276 family)
MADADSDTDSWLGPGISYRRQYYQALLDLGQQMPLTIHGRLVLEIIPDHFFAHPQELALLAEHYCLVFHDVGLSLATVGQESARRRRLQRLKALVELARPVLFSDHLAMTMSPEGLDCGHLAPAWYTAAVLEHVVEHVQQCQDILGIPCAVENIAMPFELPASMGEAEFMTRLVERTGCGLLLDLANVLCNARNFHYDAVALVQQYPLAAVQQIHLAGGLCHQGWWVDSHSTPVEEASFALLRTLTKCHRVKTIVVERDHSLPSLSVLIDEAQHAAHLWHGVHPGVRR